MFQAMMPFLKALGKGAMTAGKFAGKGADMAGKAMNTATPFLNALNSPPTGGGAMMAPPPSSSGVMGLSSAAPQPSMPPGMGGMPGGIDPAMLQMLLARSGGRG